MDRFAGRVTPVTTPGRDREIGVRIAEIEFANRRSLVTVPLARLLVHPPSPATGSFRSRVRDPYRQGSQRPVCAGELLPERNSSGPSAPSANSTTAVYASRLSSRALPRCLAHPRLVVRAHRAVHPHGAAPGAHEGQHGREIVAGRVAVVRTRPGVPPLGQHAGLRLDAFGGREFGTAAGGGGEAQAERQRALGRRGTRLGGLGVGATSGRRVIGVTGSSETRASEARSSEAPRPSSEVTRVRGILVAHRSRGGHGQRQGDRERDGNRRRDQSELAETWLAVRRRLDPVSPSVTQHEREDNE